MFIPIEIDDYVRLHVKNNPSVDPKDLTRRLQCALDARMAGELCDCGNTIWVIGSAEVGRACFTCITGEATPSDDYEIAVACDMQINQG